MIGKNKWNRKYTERIKTDEPVVENKRLRDLAPYLKGKTALDLACGLGGNSLFLAQIGYDVLALDVSEVAISYLKDKAKNQQLNIHAAVADLTHSNHLISKKNKFDLIVMTYYLDRSIFPIVKSALTNNGYFFMETFFMSPLKVKPEMPNKYKLHSNELLTEFKGWKILFYEESEVEGRQTIFCQKLD